MTIHDVPMHDSIHQIAADLQDAYHYAATALGEEDTFCEGRIRRDSLRFRLDMLDKAREKLDLAIRAASRGKLADSMTDAYWAHLDTEPEAPTSEDALMASLRSVWALTKCLAADLDLDARTAEFVTTK